MVDNLNAEAKITLDADEYVNAGKAVEEANKAIEESADGASKSIDGLETTLGEVGGATSRAADASTKLAEETDKVEVSTKGLAATRYALYDVAATWGAVSAATLGAATAVQKVGSDYEYAFSSVRRVTETAGEQAATLNQDLKDLASTIHEEFTEIAGVATIGGQMGVATAEIKEFTRNVTMFGATTTATIDETAMGFGRIAQLTKSGTDSWESIGSAIYQVGVTSVATESQILHVAQEIATAGNLAGFSTDEVIGLAGALASLGVQPERARGNILRVFSEIDKAIAEGGESLENFGRTAGMSAAEFAEAWSTNPERAFNSLIVGLNNASEAGANLGQEIRNLGIVAVRDVQTMQQLANNTDVYARAMMNASEAYAEGTALMDAYGIRSDTVVGKLQILNNVIKNVMDSLSANSAVKIFLDGLISIGRALETILKNPVASTFGAISVALLGIVGVSAAVRAGIAAMQASILALRLAIINLNSPAIQGMDLSLRGLIATLSEFSRINTSAASSSAGAATAKRAQTQATKELTAATVQANAATASTVSSTGAAVAASGRLARGFGAIGNAAKLLFGSFRVIPQFAAISAGIWGISKAINYFAGEAGRAKEAARDMFGSLSGLGDGIAADTEAYKESGEYMRLLGVNTETSSIIWDSATLSQEELADAIRDTTEAAEEQIVAMGKATEQALLDSITSSEGFADSWINIKDAATIAGIEIEDIMEGIKTGTVDGILTPLVDAADEDIKRLSEIGDRLYREIEGIRSELRFTDPGDTLEIERLNDILAVKESELEINRSLILTREEEHRQLTDLHTATRGLNEITGDLIISQGAALEFAQMWAGVNDEAGESAEGLSISLQELLDTMEEAHNAEAKMESLTNTLLENGTAIGDMTAEGRASFMALSETISYFADQADGDTWAFATSLAESWAHAEGAGINLGGEVDFLHQTLAGLFTEQWDLALNTQFARDSIAAFMDDAISAIRVRAELERQQIQANFANTRGSGAWTEYTRQIAEIDRVANQQIATVESLKSSLSDVAERGKAAAESFYNPPSRKGGGGGSPMAKDAKDAQKEVRTLTDYVKDLGSVMSASFEFRFGGIIAQDDLDSARRSLQELADRAVDRVVQAFEGLDKARQSVSDLKVSLQDLGATISGLGATKDQLQYFYKIAVDYGDTLRATQILAQLDKVNADLAKAENDRKKTNSDLAKAQDNVTSASEELSNAQKDVNRTLVGSTESAAEQRKAVMDLLKAYQNQVIALADTGMSQQQLQRETDKLRQAFEKELRQLGYNRTEVGKYSKAFLDMSTIIKNIPPANVKVNVNPALRALDEFGKKLDKQMKGISGKTYAGPKVSAPQIAGAGAALERALNNMVASYMASGNYQRDIATAVRMSKGVQSRASIEAGLIRSYKDMMRRSLGFKDGGYTGYGGQNQIAGVVHRGEYVFPQESVNQRTGLPHADVLARMMMGSREFGNAFSGMGSSQGLGDGSVYISGFAPGAVQLLARAVQPYLVMNDKIVAQANASANKRSSLTGSN